MKGANTLIYSDDIQVLATTSGQTKFDSLETKETRIERETSGGPAAASNGCSIDRDIDR